MRKSVRQKCEQMFDHMVKKQRSLDYNYYLTKNCPLLDNWTERKKQMLADAQAGPQKRGNVFK